MTQPQAELFDLYRAGLKTAADIMKAGLESAERLQNQQLVAIRSAIDQQQKSVSELARATTLDELMAFQTRLAGAQFERAMSYWGDLVQLATENQTKAIGQIQEQARWLSEATASAAAGTRESAHQQQEQRGSA
jgi:phasin family protein